MNRESAELVVVIAMEGRAREVVALAQDPQVVDAANAEWKRLAKRRAMLEETLREAEPQATDAQLALAS